MRRSVLAVVLIASSAAGAHGQQVHTGASNMGGGLLGSMVTSTVPLVSMPGQNRSAPMFGGRSGATHMAPSAVILPPVNPALANSAHTFHADIQGQRSYNQTGVATTAPSLNFTTQWTTNASGQTPDLDTHVLLPAGNPPYTVVNPQNPVGVNTPHRPWPLGSPDFPRNVYYVQPQINFNGGSAKISADVEGINRTVGTCVYGGGACEEVRITSNNATTSSLPSGATNVYKQQTYRPIAFPSPPPNASGAGSTYRTYVWASPGIMIDSIKVGGAQVLAASQVVNAITSPQMSGALTTDTLTSPEIEVTIRNVPAHAEGVREGLNQRRDFFAGNKTRGLYGTTSINLGRVSRVSASTSIAATVDQDFQATLGTYWSEFVALARVPLAIGNAAAISEAYQLLSNSNRFKYDAQRVLASLNVESARQFLEQRNIGGGRTGQVLDRISSIFGPVQSILTLDQQIRDAALLGDALGRKQYTEAGWIGARMAGEGIGIKVPGTTVDFDISVPGMTTITSIADNFRAGSDPTRPALDRWAEGIEGSTKVPPR